jgi:hypothetical protein
MHIYIHIHTSAYAYALHIRIRTNVHGNSQKFGLLLDLAYDDLVYDDSVYDDVMLPIALTVENVWQPVHIYVM